MGYSTVQDVVDATGTELDSAIIGRLIDSGDRKIRTRLRTENMSYSFGAVPDEILEASIHYAAALVMQRHMVDGTLPSSQSISGTSASVDAGGVWDEHNKAGDKQLQDYIDRAGERTSCYHVCGIEGERTGDYRVMTQDEQEDN
jgi:hypothetical protein